MDAVAHFSVQERSTISNPEELYYYDYEVIKEMYHFVTLYKEFKNKTLISSPKIHIKILSEIIPTIYHDKKRIKYNTYSYLPTLYLILMCDMVKRYPIMQYLPFIITTFGDFITFPEKQYMSDIDIITEKGGKDSWSFYVCYAQKHGLLQFLFSSLFESSNPKEAIIINDILEFFADFFNSKFRDHSAQCLNDFVVRDKEPENKIIGKLLCDYLILKSKSQQHFKSASDRFFNNLLSYSRSSSQKELSLYLISKLIKNQMILPEQKGIMCKVLPFLLDGFFELPADAASKIKEIFSTAFSKGLYPNNEIIELFYNKPQIFPVLSKQFDIEYDIDFILYIYQQIGESSFLSESLAVAMGNSQKGYDKVSKLYFPCLKAADDDVRHKLVQFARIPHFKVPILSSLSDIIRVPIEKLIYKSSFWYSVCQVLQIISDQDSFPYLKLSSIIIECVDARDICGLFSQYSFLRISNFEYFLNIIPPCSELYNLISTRYISYVSSIDFEDCYLESYAEMYLNAFKHFYQLICTENNHFGICIEFLRKSFIVYDKLRINEKITEVLGLIKKLLDQYLSCNIIEFINKLKNHPESFDQILSRITLDTTIDYDFSSDIISVPEVIVLIYRISNNIKMVFSKDIIDKLESTNSPEYQAYLISIINLCAPPTFLINKLIVLNLTIQDESLPVSNAVYSIFIYFIQKFGILLTKEHIYKYFQIFCEAKNVESLKTLSKIISNYPFDKSLIINGLFSEKPEISEISFHLLNEIDIDYDILMDLLGNAPSQSMKWMINLFKKSTMLNDSDFLPKMHENIVTRCTTINDTQQAIFALLNLASNNSYVFSYITSTFFSSTTPSFYLSDSIVSKLFEILPQFVPEFYQFLQPHFATNYSKRFPLIVSKNKDYINFIKIVSTIPSFLSYLIVTESENEIQQSVVEFLSSINEEITIPMKPDYAKYSFENFIENLLFDMACFDILSNRLSNETDEYNITTISIMDINNSDSIQKNLHNFIFGTHDSCISKQYFVTNPKVMVFRHNGGDLNIEFNQEIDVSPYQHRPVKGPILYKLCSVLAKTQKGHHVFLNMNEKLTLINSDDGECDFGNFLPIFTFYQRIGLNDEVYNYNHLITKSFKFSNIEPVITRIIESSSINWHAFPKDNDTFALSVIFLTNYHNKELFSYLKNDLQFVSFVFLDVFETILKSPHRMIIINELIEMVKMYPEQVSLFLLLNDYLTNNADWQFISLLIGNTTGIDELLSVLCDKLLVIDDQIVFNDSNLPLCVKILSSESLDGQSKVFLLSNNSFRQTVLKSLNETYISIISPISTQDLTYALQQSKDFFISLVCINSISDRIDWIKELMSNKNNQSILVNCLKEIYPPDSIRNTQFCDLIYQQVIAYKEDTRVSGYIELMGQRTHIIKSYPNILKILMDICFFNLENNTTISIKCVDVIDQMKEIFSHYSASPGTCLKIRSFEQFYVICSLCAFFPIYYCFSSNYMLKTSPENDHLILKLWSRFENAFKIYSLQSFLTVSSSQISIDIPFIARNSVILSQSILMETPIAIFFMFTPAYISYQYYEGTHIAKNDEEYARIFDFSRSILKVFNFDTLSKYLYGTNDHEYEDIMRSILSIIPQFFSIIPIFSEEIRIMAMRYIISVFRVFNVQLIPLFYKIDSDFSFISKSSSNECTVYSQMINTLVRISFADTQVVKSSSSKEMITIISSFVTSFRVILSSPKVTYEACSPLQKLLYGLISQKEHIPCLFNHFSTFVEVYQILLLDYSETDIPFLKKFFLLFTKTFTDTWNPNAMISFINSFSSSRDIAERVSILKIILTKIRISSISNRPELISALEAASHAETQKTQINELINKLK